MTAFGDMAEKGRVQTKEPSGPHSKSSGHIGPTWMPDKNFQGSKHFPDSKIQGANMGPIWGRQDPVGPHVGPVNSAEFVINGLVGVILPNGAFIMRTEKMTFSLNCLAPLEI